MPMRVIAGSAKGRHLKRVPGDSTRPILDRVKEALFNLIGHEIVDSAFLDLFSGTGSVAIEALSRGAAHATLIDMDGMAIKTIHENLALTKLADKALVLRADALKLLRQPPRRHYQFIYIAPPQYKSLWKHALELLDDNPAWLGPDTVVIVQIDPKEQTALSLKHLASYDERRYGKTLLWFFETTDPPADEVSPSQE